MGQLAVMGRAGDTKVSWDKTKPDEVDVAKRAFDELKAKGYLAFSVKRLGGKGDQITEFDADAESIILAAPMAGGAR